MTGGSTTDPTPVVIGAATVTAADPGAFATNRPSFYPDPVAWLAVAVVDRALRSGTVNVLDAGAEVAVVAMSATATRPTMVAVSHAARPGGHDARCAVLSATGVAITDTTVAPRPARPVPLWMGGGTARTGGVPGPRVADRIARSADGFTLSGVLGNRIRRGGALAAALRAKVAAAGRDPAAFGVDARLVVPAVVPGGWAQAARGWRAAGATHLTVDSGRSTADVDGQIALLAEVHAGLRAG